MGILASAFLIGCAEMSYNDEPRTMKLKDSSAPTALILGQAYKESAGHYIILIVKGVDGAETFSGWEARTPYNWYVPAGSHKFTVHAAFGTFARSLEGDPVFSGEVRAGRVYQLYGRRYEDNNGDPFVKLWLEELGSISQYKEFKERNPDQPGGRPLSKGRLGRY
jgi:hypothetical protein